MVQRVATEKLPSGLEAKSHGETVMIGKLGVRKDGLSYKDQRLEWSEVRSLVVVLKGGDSTLQVRRQGAFLPWCSVDPNMLPNNELLAQLLIRVAPAHLRMQKDQ